MKDKVACQLSTCMLNVLYKMIFWIDIRSTSTLKTDWNSYRQCQWSTTNFTHLATKQDYLPILHGLNVHFVFSSYLFTFTHMNHNDN